jgi:Arf-GAP/coiled-coil/ANK repeat/PH domain-containing protein
MYTESAFHHQSYEILKDLEPYMRDLTGLLHDVSIIFNSRHFILIIVL